MRWGVRAHLFLGQVVLRVVGKGDGSVLVNGSAVSDTCKLHNNDVITVSHIPLALAGA